MNEIENINAVFRELDKLKSPEKINKGLKKACAIIEKAAKKKAPKGDGALRRSITSEVKNEIGTVFTPLEYAPYVEYGTGLFAEKGGRQDVPWRYQDDKGDWYSTYGQHPQPFMRPALQESREEILKAIKEVLARD